MKPTAEQLERSIKALVNMAEESNAAVTKLVLRNNDEQPIGLLLYVTGPDTDLYDRAVSLVEDTFERGEDVVVPHVPDKAK